MLEHFRPAIILLAAMTLITGLGYPLAVTGVAQTVTPRQANGSLIYINGHSQGSELIGQPFDDPRYFWGRLSANPSFSYNAAASSGSNLGPLNPALIEAVKDRIHALKAADPDNNIPIPVDLVTSSASGLDPHISPAAALYQVPRVARARGLGEDVIRSLVTQATDERQFGILGEPRVNVLKLNIELDSQ